MDGPLHERNFLRKMYGIGLAWLIIALLLCYCVTGDTIAKEIPILIN